MSDIFRKKTQPKPNDPPKPKELTEEEKKKIAEEKAQEEAKAKALAEAKAKEEANQKELDKQRKEKEKKDRERKDRERKEAEEQQKQSEREAMKLEIDKAIETKLTSFKEDIQTQIKQTQQTMVPNALDTQIKHITLEQEKLKVQLEVLDKIKELAKPQVSGFLLYDRKIIQIFLRAKYPELEKYTDKELDTEEKIKSLPFYAKYPYQDQQMILFMATCIRRAGMIEIHNLILSEMNEHQFKPSNR